MTWYQVKIRPLYPATAICMFISFVFFPGCVPENSVQTKQRASWHNNQGVVYMDQHNYTRASTEFKRAVQLDPTYAKGHANLGIAFYSLGQYDSAMVSLRTALRHDHPDHLHAHYTLGLIYNAQGKEHEEALKAFQTVLRSDPDDPLVHYYIGQVKAKLGDRQAAVEEFHNTIRLDPTNVSAHYALANQFRHLGQPEKFQQTLEKFNQLSQAGHQGISASYQGQGKYAEATTDAGYANPDLDDFKGPMLFSKNPRQLEEFDGKIGFATAANFAGDAAPDLLIGADIPLAYRNIGGAFSRDSSLNFVQPAPFAISDATFADWDNNSHPDLLLSGTQTLLLHSDGAGKWAPAAPPLPPSLRSIFADVDHDGDLDLLVLEETTARLWANDGTGAFADISNQAGLAANASAHQAFFTDFDNDRDIDFLILSNESLQLYTNNRDGTFSNIAAPLGLVASSPIALCVEDFNQDSYMDLCSLSASGSLTLLTNEKGKKFTARSLDMDLPEPLHGMRPADFDNDGDIDLLLFGADGIHPLVWHQREFHLQDRLMHSDKGNQQVLVADFDTDGTPDVWADGQYWRNETTAGNWIAIDLLGLNSNRDGIGTKVEVKTTNRLQKKELRGGSGGPDVLHFGLAREDSVEFIRILWPGGVRQTELATPARRRLELTELDRKGTSCPILYAWDGTQFRFVTDILGGAIIGYLTAPGHYNTPDTDEYVALDKIAPRDGRYVLKIANQLEEIIYLDALHLVAVDHPADVRVFPNERLLAAPPYPDFRLYPLKNLRPLQGAVDYRGKDIQHLLQSVDDNWYEGFELTSIHGYAREHSITLDVGDIAPDSHPVLLAHGWVDYAHSTSNWAAAQQGLSLSPPRVEVPDERGDWITASTDMGCPAGLPKNMLFDLKGIFKSSDHRLRITTNAAIYWDQFQVASRVEAPLQIQRLLPSRSDLQWRGYPSHTAIKNTFAFRYHYDRLQLEAEWGTHEGAFTRLGEVGELVQQADDRYVIMFHGDELTVEFSAAELMPLKPGLQRSFLLYADGFGKDMDFHSAHSLTVDPLPFHGMSSYPYPAAETYPATEAHLDYLLKYNTRYVKGYYE